MRKLVSLLAVVALAATPALADLAPISAHGIPAQGLVNPGNHTAGIVDTINNQILLSYQQEQTASDMLTLTFGFHWPYSTPVYVGLVSHSVAWDTSEVEIISMQYTAPFADSNYTALTSGWWADSPGSTDTVGFGTFAEFAPLNQFQTYFGGTGPATSLIATPIGSSDVIPFAQVNLHVDGIDLPMDSLLDLFAYNVKVWFRFTPYSIQTGYYYTLTFDAADAHGVDFIPEPASLALLGLGMVSVGAGVWRRRRR